MCIIYIGRLSLGQAIFESSGWSGAFASSARVTDPWFIRGGFAASGGTGVPAGVESLNAFTGATAGFRGELLNFHLAPKIYVGCPNIRMTEFFGYFCFIPALLVLYLGVGTA